MNGLKEKYLRVEWWHIMVEIDFKAALNQKGLITKDPISADGALHRIHIEGDSRGTQNGWYVLHDGEFPAGAFGSWKTGEKHTWSNKNLCDLTHLQRQQHDLRMQEAQQAREAEKLKRRERAQHAANLIWGTARAAPPTHPYLVRKAVKSYGIREYNGSLVVPMFDSHNVLQSLQSIDGRGNKRFLYGGRMKGCYFTIGNSQEDFLIAEGYSTAASLYEATRHCVVVAFNAGNLKPVAQAIRRNHPYAKITICADNDTKTPVNTGVEKARDAAFAVNAFLAIPPCAGDFNDLLTESAIK
jgi:putative DNA primase/helicase